LFLFIGFYSKNNVKELTENVTQSKNVELKLLLSNFFILILKLKM